MILVKNIFKSYKNDKVLKGVDLEVPNGKILSLLGANGAGKSTLINILSCIISPTSGQIFIDNEEINIDSYKYRAKVGYVFEQPMYIERFSAKEQLEFSAGMYEIPKKIYKNRIDELLNFFELPKDNKKYIEDYSKGMKAKVSLAMALINKPLYLILDEPFDGIDFLSVQKICKLFRDLASKGTTIIITSHQYDLIASVADLFSLLKNGKIDFTYTMNELKEKSSILFPNIENPVKAYLESEMKIEGSKDSISYL